MRVLTALAGFAIIVIILWDAVETIILPRRVTRRFRLTRVFYHYTWLPLSRFLYAITSERRTETLLGFYGPISLLLLLIIWAGGLISAFGFLQYAAGSALQNVEGTSRVSSIGTYFYLSGTTFFTLGLGDVIPLGPLSRGLVILEGGMGLGFLALILGYLPALNQSFARREVTITVMDAHAGSPPTAAEIIRRNTGGGEESDLLQFLSEWERWSAELLDSHLSYPFLAYFRSQHDNQSWVGALTAILDTSALLTAFVESRCTRQAWMTYAAARHAAVDLTTVFGIAPSEGTSDRLSDTDLIRLIDLLTAGGLKLREREIARERLRELRRMYEPYVLSLAGYFCLDAPPWFAEEKGIDNWESSSWERDLERKDSRTHDHF